VVRAAASGESTAELFQEIGAAARDYVRRLLDLAEVEVRVGGEAREPEEPQRAKAASGGGAPASGSLRERGAELLRQSADVGFDEEAHPAYARILEQLAPDEGRILRLLALEGAQPAVDVRTGMLPIGVASELVAPGLTLIGAEAGCRHQERLHAYLNNLYRLGLIWFSREPVQDPHRYQVLEAQPEVLEALRKAGRARTVRRSIHLTPFGEDFCDTCLPLHTEELEALPGDGGAPRDTTPADEPTA
jgi:hypothetical protein